MKRIDKSIGKFLYGIYEAKLNTKTNVIILGDHGDCGHTCCNHLWILLPLRLLHALTSLQTGMSSYKDKKWGLIGEHIKKEAVKFVQESGPMTSLQVSKKTTVKKAYKALKKFKGINVYTKAETPEHLHYKNHRNILDILLYSNGTEMILINFPSHGKSWNKLSVNPS